MYAQVIVDIAHADVDKIFEYSCDDTVQLGCRVKVPFGHQGVLDGFVVGLSATSQYPADKIRPVTAVVDEPPALLPECFTLMEHIVARYKVPKAVALRLFLPAEMRTGKVSERYKKFVYFVKQVDLNARAKKQQEALDYIQANDGKELSVLNKRFSPSAITSLFQKGAIDIRQKQVLRNPMQGVQGAYTPRTLTPAQRDAVESIRTSTQTVQLIHGVTGSGKTEIYLSYIAQVLEQGKTAIFLVPEISLTPQMLAQLRTRFGGKAAIMHSGLSAGERFDEWWRLRSGEAKIAIGARSAIFAPLENLGAIIIDEEHDTSYCSETSPRYSTIKVATWRAEYNGCKLILGSATPSVESYIEGKEGRYNLIELIERINKRPLPHISVVDMRQEVKRGNPSCFSLELREELDKTLSAGQQAIIFLNRRGYSKMVMCQDCGYVAKCEHCDVTLTYHSEDDCLKCHYCGTRYHMLSACPDCGGKHIRYSGTGTQRVVADLHELFPSARILRMDNDTVSGKDGHYKILKQFGEKQADILVGTQMIAKGHDFPSVTLVGILDADMSLHFSDYRSGERTFQLITQVAGRSGRADEVGKVVLQSCSPENYILQFACQYDYNAFFENEVLLRQATNFPPYCTIVRMMVTGEEDQLALQTLKSVWQAIEGLRGEYPQEFIFANKMHSPIKKIQGKVRYQVLMRLQTDALLPTIYELATQNTTNHTLVYVEENPNNLS